jgi:hypothetical protein
MQLHGTGLIDKFVFSEFAADKETEVPSSQNKSTSLSRKMIQFYSVQGPF